MYELPPILTGSAEDQLRALRDYLVRLTQTLPADTAAAGDTFSGTASVSRPAAARTAAGQSGASGAASPDNYPRLRALVTKTAGEIYTHIDEISRELRADYTARSELGELEERITQSMTATARGVVEDYGYDARLTAADERAGRFEEHLRSLNGQIRRGLITDPDTGEQVLGIAIAQRLSFTGSSQSYEGETYYELSPGQTLGLYTATGWQFWINGARRGWFDSVDGMLHAASMQVEQSLRLGADWLLSTTGGLGVRKE